MYFALTVKLLLNMHDLNNERAEEIRRVPVVYEVEGGYKVVSEAVAVSGVILKRYHFVNVIENLRACGEKVCLVCSRLEGIRTVPRDIPEESVREWLVATDEEVKNYKNIFDKGNESQIIAACPGEDLHGFLRTKPPLRRESLVKFSWMLPLYEKSIEEEAGTTTPYTVLQHARVIKSIPEGRPPPPKQEASAQRLAEAKLEELQMPYPRAYGDGIFGFSSIVDLKHVGYSFTEAKEVGNNKNKRRKASILAYVPIISGLAGASLARALPSCKPLEIIAYVAKSTPLTIPSPVHPIYSDYASMNVELFNSFSRLLRTDVTIINYGARMNEQQSGKFKVVKVEEPYKVFEDALRELGLEDA